ncbi:MAG: FAD-binding protein [Gammaproteobacteria bacterium]|nr:FAD-binding protein [Gammaproteobacteria bacterium]
MIPPQIAIVLVNAISLDRQCRTSADLLQPDRARHVEQSFADGGIACGARLSYVGAGFTNTGKTVSMTAFNRILAFDPDAGTVDVEAGISLGKLFGFLIEQGYELPVQPGYPAISIGGCIAGNVHGKNHAREGVFGAHVRELTLFHPSHGHMTCSESSNADVLELTIGGLGLTGVILSARLEVVPLGGAYVRNRVDAVDSLENLFERVRQSSLESDMCYGWFDLTRPKNKSSHRGLLVRAERTQEPAESTQPRWQNRLKTSAREWRRRQIFSRITLPSVNALYRYKSLHTSQSQLIHLFDFLYPAYGKESYFYGFGDAGFIEQQTLIPIGAESEYLSAFWSLLERHEPCIALTTVKSFAGADGSYLSYTGTGTSFTVDLPANANSREFLASLDQINIDVGARSAILKDGRISAGSVRRQYPEYGKFKAAIDAFDPKRQFGSELSRRLEL